MWSAQLDKSKNQPKEITVSGSVVALGGTALREHKRCRQLMVVLTANRKENQLRNTYLLVPRNYTCNAGAFTNETFRRKQKWIFPLIRGVDCDRTFGQIKDRPLISPTGFHGSVPWMKIVPGNDDKKMSETQNLLCYEINGELKRAK